jgi:hypothetical protein
MDATGRVTETSGVSVQIYDDGTLVFSVQGKVRSAQLSLRHCVLHGPVSFQSGIPKQFDQEVSEGEVVTLMLWASNGGWMSSEGCQSLRGVIARSP